MLRRRRGFTYVVAAIFAVLSSLSLPGEYVEVRGWRRKTELFEGLML